jgi:hypothetical protein
VEFESNEVAGDDVDDEDDDDGQAEKGGRTENRMIEQGKY